VVQQERFDWWAGRVSGRAAVRAARVPAPSRAARSAAAAGQAAPAPAVVRPRPVPATGAAPAESPASADAVVEADAAAVYRAVQESEAFQEIRRGYRGFVLPATGAFLGWYLLYLVAQAAAPGLMARRPVGPLNVAWILGLGQFASTFLLTWLYARNARTRRDRAALELRWDTQDQLR
jgi:uncharacterized membrane protein (DUF485 family)